MFPSHRNPLRNFTFFTLLGLLFFGFMFGASTQEQPKQNRWEPNIQRFEAKDKENPPPKSGVLFVGSSSIVMWDLEKWFPGLDAINRGFGGSQIVDSTHFADRIIIPYEPRIIFFYAGDNDVAGGKSAEQVFADYKAFVAKVHGALPKTPIVYVAIKPSIARWKLVDEMRAANALIKAHTEADPTLEFIDIDTPMIGEDGKPKPDLFLKDGLHLNDAGYELWTSLVMPYLEEQTARAPEAGVPQLFVDDAFIARKEGVVRKAHACTKLPEPVLKPERPWEAVRIYTYGTVLYDQDAGLFRMWYMSSGPELGGGVRDPRLNHVPSDFVMYATSKDGVHWDRPDLGLYAFDGSTANNIVFDFHSPSIVYNPDAANPQHVYVLFGCGKGAEKRGYCMAYSADGLHWNADANNPILPGSDTCTLARNPWTGEYLAFHKRNHEHLGVQRRLVYLSTSLDLKNWSKPQLVMAPDELDDAQTKAEGGWHSEFYNMSAFPYGDQFLGFVTHFRYTGEPPEKGPEQSNDDGPIDVQLVHSRDGRTWHRCEDRSPVIPNGPHAYDAGCILGTVNSPVIVGDEMWIYYTAITTTHGGYLPKKKITIARAVWPLDRFVSLDAAEAGIVQTKPFTAPGTRLLVNADASGGQLTVAVLDADGKPIPGYEAAECVPIQSDGLRHEIAWRDHKDLRDINNMREIRLRFHLEDASLFSYTAN